MKLYSFVEANSNCLTFADFHFLRNYECKPESKMKAFFHFTSVFIKLVIHVWYCNLRTVLLILKCRFTLTHLLNYVQYIVFKTNIPMPPRDSYKQNHSQYNTIFTVFITSKL